MSWLMWLAVIVLVIAAIAAKVRRAGIVMIRPNTPPRRPENAKAASERMLRCEHCSIYIPESEAVHRSGTVFCSQDHGLRYFSH